MRFCLSIFINWFVFVDWYVVIFVVLFFVFWSCVLGWIGLFVCIMESIMLSGFWLWILCEIGVELYSSLNNNMLSEYMLVCVLMFEVFIVVCLGFMYRNVLINWLNLVLMVCFVSLMFGWIVFVRLKLIILIVGILECDDIKVFDGLMLWWMIFFWWVCCNVL